MTNEHPSVAELAYQLWEARGRPGGSAERDWDEAERQLSGDETANPSLSKAVDESLEETFPASDPPASHGIDEPPANADAKWKAAGRTRPAARAAPVRKPIGSTDRGRAPTE